VRVNENFSAIKNILLSMTRQKSDKLMYKRRPIDWTTIILRLSSCKLECRQYESIAHAYSIVFSQKNRLWLNLPLHQGRNIYSTSYNQYTASVCSVHVLLVLVHNSCTRDVLKHNRIKRMDYSKSLHHTCCSSLNIWQTNKSK
jgi:hypothetical protein